MVRIFLKIPGQLHPKTGGRNNRQKAKIIGVVPFALGFLFVLGSCTNKGETPEEIARMFLDKYYIEIDQEGALPISAGLAEKKLKEELKLVEGIRGMGVSPQQAKPNIYYKFQDVKESGPATKVFRYKIIIKGGPQEVQKDAIMIVSKVNNVWKVTNYDTFEASSPP
ncbi:MAG TPA: hypothetical protein VNM22_19330 [Candidatus Limnocylindrales bacterium]|nr:hypothetical protein [Candidatus Limnocylindrales bacterium]